MAGQTPRHQAAATALVRTDMLARRSPRGVRIGDLVTMQSPEMGSISASDVGGLCRADQLQAPVEVPPNLRDCRFQIYPKLRYASREALKQLRAAGGSRGLSRKIRSLEAAVHAEEELNVREFETHFGGEVRHGMVIQLLHLTTGKFLTASGAIATIERDCHRVSLTEGEEGSGWFVRPVFKFQQTGYPLLYNDDFYLEALGGKLGFLHISESPDDTWVKISSYVQQTFEVNCAQDKDHFRLCQYREGHVHKEKEASGCFFGDDIVTIHLWERDSLLAAKLSGSAGPHDLPRVCFLKALRGRRRADAMWKIEHQELRHAGDAVVFKKPFRLKHIATGLYMASKDPATSQRNDTANNVGSNLAVPTLQSDVYLTPYYYCPAGHTLWEFVAASDADTSIQSSSPLYLRSIGSCHWLHSLHATGAPPKEESARLGEQRYSTHYVQLSLIDDAEDVHTVDRLRTFRRRFLDLAEDANDAFTLQGDGWVGLHKQLRVTEEGLGECIRLCIRDCAEEEEDPLLLVGEPCAQSQFLLYDVGVLQAVVYLIQCLSVLPQEQDDAGECEFGGRSRFPPEGARVLQLGYWLMKAACAGCTDLKSFLAPWLGMFVEHVSLGIHAPVVLREIFTDNNILLTKGPQQEIHEVLDHLVASYVQRRSPRCFRIFECMSTCEGVPIPFVQHLLTESLLQKHKDALPRLEGGPGTLRIAGDMLAGAEPFSPRCFNGREHEVAQNMLLCDTDDAPEMHAYCLMLCTLELFAALTFGRNRLASEELQKPHWNLSREVLFSVIKDSTFPSGFRRACLLVMQRLYVDMGDAKVVVAINHTHVWSETLQDLKAQASEDKPLKRKVSVHEWNLIRTATQAVGALRLNRLIESSHVETMIEELHNVFEEHVAVLQELVESQPMDHTMTDKFLGAPCASSEAFELLGKHTEEVQLANALLLALHQMAEFGMLRLGDAKETKMVESVTENLIKFLALPINTRPMQHCKMSTCVLLQRIFAMRTNFRLGKVFEAYDQQFGDGGTNGDEDAWKTIFQDLHAELFEASIRFARVGSSDPQQVPLARMGSAFADALLNVLASDVELDCKSKCLELLFAETGERALLVREAVRCTVLTHTESVTAYNRVSEAVAIFDRTLPELGYQGLDKAICVAYDRATATVVSLSELCMLTCDESEEGYSREAVRRHQDLMRDLNVHRCILAMLKLPLRRRKVPNELDEAVDQNRCKLMHTCYAFIKLFVAQNSQNQELIFPQMGHFMTHVGVKTIDAASAVAAVVQDNMLLVAQIRDVDLRVFVTAIAKYGKRPRWLHMLRDVLRVHGQWIRRNQSIVIGLLLEVPDFVLELDGDQEGAQQNPPCTSLASRRSNLHPNTVGPAGGGNWPKALQTCVETSWNAAMLDRASSDKLLLDRAVLMREGNKTRLELMIARDQDNGLSSFLCYHTSCIELLGFCCAGQNQVCQMKCRNLLSVQDAITAIACCHHTEEGLAHPQVDGDTLRLVRSAFLKFIHHCYAESAPHKLFDDVHNLWGGESTALTGVLTQEVSSLHEAILQENFDWRKSQEHLDFVFLTVLPFYTTMLHSFAPEPVPPAITDFVQTLARCCDAFEGRWQAQHLDALENFVASLPDIDGLEDTTDHLIEAIEKLRAPPEQKVEQLRVNSREAVADKFRNGFPRFVQGLSWGIGVDPAQILGSGLKAMVRNIASRGQVMEHMALVITEEAKSAAPGRIPFLLNCIRAVRGYLCGIQSAREEAAQAGWNAFISHQQPSDEDLGERQEHVAASGIIKALAEVLSHSHDLIIREVLFTLQASLAVRNSSQPALGPATALIKYLSEEGQRRHFAASCAELFRRAVLGLQERERLVKRRQEQESARKRAQLRRANTSSSLGQPVLKSRSESEGFEDDDAESDSNGCRRHHSVMNEGDESTSAADSSQATGAAHASSTGHPLELLAMLTNCLQGGCRSDVQDLLFVTGMDKATNKDDILGELVKYLQQSERLVQFSAAHGDDHLLRVAKQAFQFLCESIRGPNAAVVQVIINQTDIVEASHNWLVALPYDGVLDKLKFDVKNTILMFTLTILQNCTPDMGYVARKWLSQDCDKAFLDTWLVASGGSLPQRQRTSSVDPGRQHKITLDTPRAQTPQFTTVMFENSALEAKAAEAEVACKNLGDKLDEQAFLSFLVISYLADSNSAPTELRAAITDSESLETFSRECARVEVRRNENVYQLRFRVPAVCASLQAKARFASEVQRVVHQCVEREEEEESRPALFQSSIVKLIQRELHQSEQRGRSLLGLLVHHQNWVWRLPVFATLLMNAWLLVFGPGSSSPGHDGEGIVSGGSNDSAAADLVGVCLDMACNASGNDSALEGTAVDGPQRMALVAGVGVLAFFHNLCYIFRFVLVMSTSTARHELLFEPVLLLCSIAGSIFSPFLFTVHVLEFFSAPSARMLLSAATLNCTKLGQAGLIILLTVYVYAVVGFRFFKERHVEGKCSTLLNCVLSYLDGGLTGSGMHDAINLETPHSLWASPVVDWVIQLFAMSFLTIYVQVLLAIFSGIIIDSFGALRDQHAEVTAHLNESSHLLSHGTYDQYVNLLVFLHVSDPRCLTDLEKYVYCQVMADCSDWLPYRLDRCLQGDDAFGEPGRVTESLCERVDGLSDKMDNICHRMERIEKSLEALGCMTPGNEDGALPVSESEGSSSDAAARHANFEQAMEDRWNSTNEQLKAIYELLQQRK